MLRVKKMSDSVGKHVYTSDGDYFGQIEDVNLADNRVEGWKIKISGGFMNVLGGARGVIIPQQFVKAIGDIFIVNRASLPARDETLERPIETAEGAEGENTGFESF
jgi:sporulation protein YlmC with PRC-barrel domain